MMDRTAQYAIFETVSCFCAIAWNAAGIARFQLPTRTAEAAGHLMLRRLPDALPGTPPAAVAQTIDGAIRYFAGEAVDFSGVALDLDGQDAFFQQVYVRARQVGYGRTTTYGALAKELGAGPEAARDVGQAMAKNPVPLIIPCHRVLAAGGRLGGFPRPAARPPRSGCWNWRASAWPRHCRRSSRSGSRRANMSHGMQKDYVYKSAHTPVGALTLIASNDGLAAILWENDRPGRVRLNIVGEDPDHPILVETERQLAAYFAGQRRTFDLKLDFAGTDFQKTVWAALLTIPFGETRTYAEIARQIGAPKAVRAVGAANGRNPISIIAPCHRVLGSSGHLTGFAGGLETKAQLLVLEGLREAGSG